MISKLYLFSKDTDNPAATGGLQYQILKTLETWLSNYLLQVEEEIYCDFEEDIFQHNPLTKTVRFRQLKLYSRNFAFQSEEIKKALAHFFMLHVKTDYQDKDKEFIFEANSRVADHRKGNEANLLRNWVANQEALPEELLTACAEQVKSIIEEYVHQRADQLESRVAADELQEALDIFQQLQDADWFAFTKSIKWRFEDLSSDEEFKRTIVQIETLIAALPFETAKGQLESLFGLLYKHVSLKSRETDPQNRKLTADDLTSLMLQAGSEKIQNLSYQLCYTYARCTKAVSMVPPTYYAHLAAFRSKFHFRYGDGESSTSGSESGVGVFTPVRAGLDRTMYFL